MLSLSTQAALVLALSIGILYILQKCLTFWKGVGSLHNHPGYRTLLSPATILSNLLERPISGIALGRNHAFFWKHRIFAEKDCDIVSLVAMFPNFVHLFVADAAAIKEITFSRARFPKPVQHYTALSFFGHNIVASEGEEWKKYRKIASPAFSDRNNKLVWDETVKIVTDLLDTVWQNQETVVTDHVVDITLPIALFVIGVAGFGRRISWQDDDVVPPGHDMTFKESLHIVSTDVLIKLIFPEWAMGLTKRSRNVRTAFDELEYYMREMIRQRRTAEKKEERYDLFSSFLDANDVEESGEAKLTESELIGNIFIFLLAGHETTAHTLAFTFALLALYPDQQEILYQHIKSVIPDGRIPSYEEMPLFTQSMAVFYETLRMYPPVNNIPKVSAEDTVLTTTNSNNETVTIPVPRGTDISIHVPGLHYNPRYWKDPETFDPSRFLGDWPRDAFLPFSGGARACLGRKFFETEGIAILTILISRYKIEVKEEPQFAAESFEERKARILKTRNGLTLMPVRVPLVFKRR